MMSKSALSCSSIRHLLDISAVDSELAINSNGSESADNEVRAADVEMREGRPHFDLVTPAGRDAVGMRAVGAHQVSNALAVAAVGTALSPKRITCP